MAWMPPSLPVGDDQDVAAELKLDWHTVKTLDQQYSDADEPALQIFFWTFR